MSINKNPYISFVVVARNDNYGGDFLNRINVFIKVLLDLCEKHALDMELIIVEWNPPKENPRLKEVLEFQKNLKHCNVRIIEVPNEVHQKMPNSDKMPVFEYIGKNVGIRRAKGEYILATNPDIIFDEEIIRFLASKKLSQKCFYSAVRADVRAPGNPNLSVEKILEYCKRNTIFIAGHVDSYVHIKRISDLEQPIMKLNSWEKLKQRIKPVYMKFLYFKKILWHLPFSLPHDNCPGDFLLMHRDNWFKLRGYPELKSHSVIDRYEIYMALTSGLLPKVILNKFLWLEVILGQKYYVLGPKFGFGSIHIYHQDHDRREYANRPITDTNEFNRNIRIMIKTRKPIVFNDEIWGVSNEKLCEIEIH